MKEKYIESLEQQNLDLREKLEVAKDEMERVLDCINRAQDLIYTIDVGLVDYITNSIKKEKGKWVIGEKEMNTLKGKEGGISYDIDEILDILQEVTGVHIPRNPGEQQSFL